MPRQKRFGLPWWDANRDIINVILKYCVFVLYRLLGRNRISDSPSKKSPPVFTPALISTVIINYCISNRSEYIYILLMSI